MTWKIKIHVSLHTNRHESKAVCESIRAAVTIYYKLIAYKQQKLVSHSSGGWKAHDLGTSVIGLGPSSWFIVGTISVCPHMVRISLELFK